MLRVGISSSLTFASLPVAATLLHSGCTFFSLNFCSVGVAGKSVQLALSENKERARSSFSPFLGWRSHIHTYCTPRQRWGACGGGKEKMLVMTVCSANVVIDLEITQCEEDAIPQW
jgi:hypothetical protein